MSLEEREVIICDYCNKDIDDKSEYLYTNDAGMLYIANTYGDRIDLSDIHFCNEKCFLKYIKQEINKFERH